MGVSAAAKLALDAGLIVTGSDLSRSKTTEALEAGGAKIHYGAHKAELIEVCQDAVVYSRAVTEDNPEFQEAQKKDKPLYSYPEFIGMLTRKKKVIAISGTHGKTTTTGLIGKMLIDAGLDPTVIVGSYISDFNGNARLGKSEYVVLEADEYRNAFAHYNPYVSVVTTIDFDHPDCFTDLDDVKKHFTAFLERTSQNGMLVASVDDKNVKEVVDKLNVPISTSGENADYSYANMSFEDGTSFSATLKNGTIEEFNLALSGKHNVQNALTAIAVADFLKIDMKSIQKTFSEYHGAWRRFEVVAEKNGVAVVDDYAHHPKEISVTIEAARSRIKSGKVIAVFQPHHQERTKALFNDFAEALSTADVVLLTNIYKVPGRLSENSVDIYQMAEKIGKKTDIHYFEEKSEIPEKASQIARSGDMILVMGAGDINTITPKLVQLI